MINMPPMDKAKNKRTMSDKDLQNTSLLGQIKALIVQSRQQLAVSVNSALSLLYWQIGKRINEEILINTRADYGQQIMESLSTQLTLEYGKGWSKRQLHHCVRFAEIFPDEPVNKPPLSVTLPLNDC